MYEPGIIDTRELDHMFIDDMEKVFFQSLETSQHRRICDAGIHSLLRCGSGRREGVPGSFVLHCVTCSFAKSFSTLSSTMTSSIYPTRNFTISSRRTSRPPSL